MVDEETIISLARQGQRSAFRNLYESYRQEVYRLAYLYTRSQQDAEDIMQETFIKAFKGIGAFDVTRGSGFSAWIKRICIHCAIDHLRTRKKRNSDRLLSLSDPIHEPQSRTVSPEKAAMVRQGVLLIRRALEHLSPKQRVIFDLRYSEHMDIKEIAAHLRCSENSIKTHLFRATSKLKKKLEPLWEKQ